MKTMQLISLVVTLLLSIFIVNRPVYAAPVAASVAVLAVPTLQDTSLGPMTMFSINITVADVEEMFAFQFMLNFDPYILMALSFSSYYPFTEQWPSEIGLDYVSVAFSAKAGQPDRLTTVDPEPIAKIDFVVLDYGRSILYLSNTELTKTTPSGAETFTHEVRHAFFGNIPPAEPGLIPSIYTSRPSAHDITGITVTLPEMAYDGGEGTAAFFNYGSGSDFENYFQVTTFKIPSWVGTPPPIAHVDFKMKYSAQANPAGEKYQIEYYVDPSPNPIVLQIWTNETYETATREWLDQLEPNDATWTWTDVANIKFRVSVSQLEGTSAPSIFNEYEAWVEVTIGAEPLPTPKLSVNPPSITAPYKTLGETFTINITATDFIDLSGYNLILSYDTFVLTATSFGSYDPFTLSMPSEINDTRGEVKMAYSMPYGVSEGFWGTAPIANITFSVDYLGESALGLHDVQLSDPFGPYATAYTVQDGYFRNVDEASIPTASFTYSPPAPIEQQTITFDASGSTPNGGAITEYSWNFGDDTPPVSVTSATTTHSYAWRGTYTVALHVFDSENVVGGVTENVTVTGHDVAVYTIDTDPSPFPYGQVMDINVTVRNEGDFTETFDVTAKYNETTIDTQSGIVLGSGLNTTLTFNWDTTGLALGMYNISATAGPVANEYDTADNTYYDPELKRVGSRISISPTSGPMGTNVTVKGSGFLSNSEVLITFDDQLMSRAFTDEYGNLTATFNVPLSSAGLHAVKVTICYPYIYSVEEEFTVIDVTPLNVSVDVGGIHFAGENVTFYVQITFKGAAVDATSINALLYKPDETTEALTAQLVVTGFYKTTYTVPGDAPTGTYALVIEASYTTSTVESHGTSFKSFLLSPTLTLWNALLVGINGTVGTIKTDVGLVEVKLDDINATLVSMEGNMAIISSTIGLIQTDVSTINAEIASINGTVATIISTLGSIQLDINAINATIVDIQDDLVTINSTLGQVEVKLDAINAKLTSIEGRSVTIETDIGTINGIIASIQGDIATIETDIGTIKTILEGWTGGTTSSIITPEGTFQILVLTTSALEGPITFSDNLVAITLSGPSGTAGTTNIVIPKQLLVGIESSIDEIVVTIDDEHVVFTYTEQPEAHLLSVTYTHSTHTMKIYLAGLPPTVSWILYVIATAIIVLVVSASLAIYRLKIRKPRVAKTK